MYLCPKCNSEMVCISTASIPPITHYECYSCGYSSKPVREKMINEVLPKEFQYDEDTKDYSDLDQVIKEYIDKALDAEMSANNYCDRMNDLGFSIERSVCIKYAEECQQIANWLIELKIRRKDDGFLEFLVNHMNPNDWVNFSSMYQSHKNLKGDTSKHNENDNQSN